MERERRILNTEEILWITGLVMLPVGIFLGYAMLRWVIPILPDSECVIHRFLGIYCPGCGGTRAVISLLHGEFLKSAWYHPLVMYSVLMYAWFMISHTLEKLHVPFVRGMKFEVWILYGMLVMIGLNFVLKNVLSFCFGIEI